MPEDDTEVTLPEELVPEEPFYFDFIDFTPGTLARAEDLNELQALLNGAFGTFAEETNAGLTRLIFAMNAFKNGLETRLDEQIADLRGEVRGLLISNTYREYSSTGDGNDDNGFQFGGGGETIHTRVMFTVPAGMTYFVTYYTLKIKTYGGGGVGTPYVAYGWPQFSGSGGGANPPEVLDGGTATGSYENPLFSIDGPFQSILTVAVDRKSAHWDALVQGYIVPTSQKDYFGMGN